MNKQGFIGDIATILLTGFIVVLGVIIMIIILNAFNTAFQASSAIPAEGKAIMDQGATEFPQYMDYFILIMLFGLPLVAGALAYFLDISGVFFWLVVIVSFLFILLGAVIGHYWGVITLDALIGASAAQIPKTNFVMNHYAIHALYTIICVAAGLFFKQRRTGI